MATNDRSLPAGPVRIARFFPERRRFASRRGAAAAILVLALGVCSPAGAGDSAAYRDLLAAHVVPGSVAGIRLNVVDYAGLRGDPAWPKALADFAAADPDSFAADADRFAFWINAYNLMALKTIVEHDGVASIRDVGNFLWPVWKRPAGVVAGRTVSLDDIEKGILKARFHDPRVHFAIVCASLSCPDLRAQPYDGPRLSAELDAAARDFFANPTKGLVVDEAARTIAVSSIFRWFGDDFAAAGGVLAFVRAKADENVRARVEGFEDADLAWIDYDWSVNDAARAK